MNIDRANNRQGRVPRILIVDDVPQNIAILVKLLEEKGYQVRAARDGSYALQSLERETADLILLDIMMPGMSGFEVCERLKEKASTASIPVIFLTAKDETEEKVKGFEMGAVDYITKPFDLEEVLARVARQLKLRFEYKNVKRTGEYQKSTLDTQKRKEICGRLVTYFEEEKPYLSDELNAEIIAKKLKVTKHNLGEAVNVEMQENISSFINRYRIEYFCELLQQEPGESIFDLALRSGYGSKSVFHAWFKTIKKTTPKKYIKISSG